MGFQRTVGAAMTALAMSMSGVWSMSASAEVVETEDYLYIGLEAEAFDSKDDRWVLTGPTTPAQSDDPDGNHSASASGNLYLEVLPDLRVTHEDTIDNTPPSFWGVAGAGPTLNYTVDFPQPGRYYVHVRAYSTGTEDNGIHVGLDGGWPESGRRMQFCTASLRAWTWGSAQRDAGGNGSCGIQKSIWLDVPTAGSHAFAVSAREDGFEIDRIAFIKDLSGNTRICSATNETSVSCVNGSIESEDGFVDLRVRLGIDAGEPAEGEEEGETPPANYMIGDSLIVEATLENLDGFDTANNITWTLSVDDGLLPSDVPADCTIDGQLITCTTTELHPTAPDENESVKFRVQALETGILPITATVTSDETDDQPDSNEALLNIDVQEEIMDTDLSIEITAAETTVDVDSTVTATIVTNNVGLQRAVDVVVTLPIPVDWMATGLPSGCTSDSSVVCALGSMDAGQTVTTAIDFMPISYGQRTLTASLTAINDVISSNNADSVSITAVTGGDTGMAGEGGTDGSTGTTTGGETGGMGTATGGTDDSGASTAGDDGGKAAPAVDPTVTVGDATEDLGAFGPWLLLLLGAGLFSTGLYRRQQ